MTGTPTDALLTEVLPLLELDERYASAHVLIQPGNGLPSRLATNALACGSVAAAGLSGLALQGGPQVVVDPRQVSVAFRSEQLTSINGRQVGAFAPLSGFFRAADGWVRTHANYEHHERALRALLGIDADAGRADVAAALRAWTAEDLEEEAAQLGAVVGAVRSVDRWRAHAHGRLLVTEPPVHRRRVGDAPPRSRAATGPLPLSGVRVLDLTRVIAGPVASRDLAFAGADVLRVDSPALQETGWIHLDTGQDKRSTLLDLRERADRETFESLLSRADVLLTGYRPGALDRFGLDPEAVAARHPGLVTGAVSAWGTSGPWRERRGFDSIVQAVSGIALAESADGTTPGALPVQALDHATGHFLAAAVVLALLEQRRDGGSIDVRISLARTADSLLRSSDPATTDAAAAPDEPSLPVIERTLPRPGASLAYAPPVLAFTGAPMDYRRVGGNWGSDTAAWAR